jgi:signal transduction histidine kinase
MPKSTLVGVAAAYPSRIMATAGVEHPGLLPAVLVPPDADPDATRLRRSTRDWIVDVAAFLLALAFGTAFFFADAPQEGVAGALVFWDLVFGVIACLLLWVRRRWPVGVALAMIPIGTFSAFAGAAGLVALFTVAVHRRFAVVAMVAAASAPALPIYMIVRPDETTPWGVSVVISVLVGVAVIAWGMFVRARRQLVLSLRERALRAESEQQLRVDQARQQERARIAREMHDVLAHRISLLSLHAGALEFRPDASPDEIAQAAGVIRAGAHQALEDLREVIGVLRDDPEDDDPERPQPTLVDLPELVDESRRAGMHVTSECRIDDPGSVPVAVGRNAYRIVQEGLTNARKHAHGAAVRVIVDGAAGSGLTVEVRNRLSVARTAAIPGAGTGIVGLAERATLAGGRLEHGTTEDGDFRLRAWLPWPA